MKTYVLKVDPDLPDGAAMVEDPRGAYVNVQDVRNTFRLEDAMRDCFRRFPGSPAVVFLQLVSDGNWTQLEESYGYVPPFLYQPLTLTTGALRKTVVRGR